jgi:hypothetical protein
MKVKGQFGGTPQNGDRQHRVAAARQPKGPVRSVKPNIKMVDLVAECLHTVWKAAKAAPVLQALRLNLAEERSRILGTPAISVPHTRRRTRFEQRRRLPNKIQRFEKSLCHHDIGLRSPEQLGDVRRSVAAPGVCR